MHNVHPIIGNNMPLKKNIYFHSVNIGTMPQFITGKKLDIWDNSLYITLFNTIIGYV